jgi:hypothetical protein
LETALFFVALGHMELNEKGNGNKLHAKSKNHPKTTQSFAWERVGQKCTKVWPTNSHL